jgi:hypothetical protein
MKRVMGVWVLCSLFSLGSFGVLLLQDRRLGVALPYSLPMAFAVIVALAPVLLSLASRIPVRPAAPQEAPAGPLDPPCAVKPMAPQRTTAAAGMVLLDFSAAGKKRPAA